MWQSEFPFVAPDRPVRSRRPLYLMIKPSPDIACRIGGLPRADPRRSDHLIHMTALGLVDLADVSAVFVPTLIAIMRDFEAKAFRVAFDTIVERRCVTLRSSEPMLGAQLFQAGLIEFLTQRDFPFFGEAPEPHVTINYHQDGRGREYIDPISWRVEEFVLIESLVGKGEHHEHGRWRLRD